jgi:hypothetical protein
MKLRTFRGVSGGTSSIEHRASVLPGTPKSRSREDEGGERGAPAPLSVPRPST